MCVYESEVLNSSFVLLMRFSAKNPRLRKYEKRYQQALTKLHRTKYTKMKLKRILFTFIILIIISCHEKTVDNNYVEYVPQVFNGNELVKVPKMLTKKHQESVINVLKYYGVEWKIENEKLLVLKNIDNEILWNYTSKANDSVWLSEHRPK